MDFNQAIGWCVSLITDYRVRLGAWDLRGLGRRAGGAPVWRQPGSDPGSRVRSAGWRGWVPTPFTWRSLCSVQSGSSLPPGAPAPASFLSMGGVGGRRRGTPPAVSPTVTPPPPYPPTGCGSFSGSFLEYYAADISESELVLVCVAHEQGAGGFWAEGGSPGARGLQGPGHCLLLPARGRGALHAEPIPLAGASVVSPGGQNTRRLPLTALGPVSSVVTATPPPLMQDGQSEPPGGPRPACRCWTRVEGSVAGRGASCQRRALRGPLRPGAQ